MLRHTEAQIIYLSHPRTASRATEQALQTVGFEWVHNASRHQRIWRCDWWCYLTPDERAQWTVTTTVRNPFDAVVGWWLNRPYHYDEMNPAWLKELLDHEHPYLLDGRLWKLHGHPADHVFRFERLPECLGWLEKYDIEPPELPKVGVTETRQGRPYQVFYTDEMRQVVRQTFAKDFEEYDYSWENLDAS